MTQVIPLPWTHTQQSSEQGLKIIGASSKNRRHVLCAEDLSFLFSRTGCIFLVLNIKNVQKSPNLFC